MPRSPAVPPDNETLVPSVYLLAGTGEPGFSGDGIALLARLGYVSGSAVDASGTIYLAQPSTQSPTAIPNSYLRKMVWTTFDPCPNTVARSLSCEGLGCRAAPPRLSPRAPQYTPGPLPQPW